MAATLQNAFVVQTQTLEPASSSLASLSPSKRSRRMTTSIFRSPVKGTRKVKPAPSPPSPLDAISHPTVHSTKRTASGSLKYLKESLRSMVPSSRKDPNVVQWLGESCPDDVLPLVLAFAGPQTAAALSTTSARWRGVMQQETTWKALSEELYKWHEGDETPHSWKDYYCQNPIVPTDFSSVRHAIKSATQATSHSDCKSIRILCRPGTHHISKAITLVDSNLNVSVETLRLPENLYQSALDAFTAQPTRAVLVQRRGTQYRNEPTIRVMSGVNLSLTNISIHHYSAGRDIWRGNAAIHVCAPESTEEGEKPAIVCLNGVEVTSSTGRGIVLAANGASLDIQNSCVHSCAATGLCIAGDRTSTRIDRTDIVFNGRGNISRGGAVPGHSGVYIEKGDLLVSNCNVSTNIGCGISVLSPDDTNVKVENSDVALNGVDALEMSFRGYSHQHAWDQNSSSVHAGEERSRSSILRST